MIEKDDLERLSKNYNRVYGYVYHDKGRSDYCFEEKAEYMASFIMMHSGANRIIITDSMDCLILNTIGIYIDRCPDKDLLKAVLKTLIPMQLDSIQPMEFPCAEMSEFNEYCNTKDFQINME